MAAMAVGAGLILAVGSGMVMAQTVTVIRGGAKAQPIASSVEVVRGRAAAPLLSSGEPSGGLGRAGGLAGVAIAPAHVAFVICPPGDGKARVSCRVRIGPTERKPSAF